MPMPAREQARLVALRGYGILDSEPERRFDDIAALARAALRTPIAMVSLVDEHRQWMMAAAGIERGEIPRAHAFCNHTILQDEPLIVEDASADARFADSPLVTGASAHRCYAGAPLLVPGGHRIGTVCVIEKVPRSFDAGELELLCALARQVVDLLELRVAAGRLEHAMERLQTLATLIPICSHCRKVRDESNHWSTLERLVQAKTGSRFTHGICPECVREHYPEAAEELLRRG